MPWVPSALFAPALRLYQSLAPARVAPSFDGAALFHAARGSTLVESTAARELFELLCIGNGSFDLLYSAKLPSAPIINTNPPRLVVEDGRIPTRKRDRQSAADPVVDADVLLGLCGQEVLARRYLGPFSLAEAVEKFGPGIIVSSAFIVRRATAVSTKDRMIHNASSRHGSVNAEIQDDYDVQLDHTAVFKDRVRAMIRRHGKGNITMCVSDISKAYRRFGVSHADVPLLGLRADAFAPASLPFFDGTTLSTKRVAPGDMLIYFDTCLPFGVSSSVSSCVRVSTFVRDLIREQCQDPLGHPLVDVCAYIDDFGTFGSRQHVPEGVRRLRAILKAIGCPENMAKLDSPSTLATYLGLVYDFDALTVTLPEAKRTNYIAHLDSFLERACIGPVADSELRSVIGKIVHAAGVFEIGKVFYQRLLAALRNGPRRPRRLDGATLDDVRWWRHLLAGSCGTVPLCPEPWARENSHRVYTDAARSGWGMCFEGQWAYGTWPTHIQAAFDDVRISISDLELLCLNFAIETWGAQLAGRRLLMRCDNTATVANVTSQSSSRPLRAALLRRLFVFAALHGIQLGSTYINTKRNEHADALSRGDLNRFLSLPQHYDLHHVQARTDAMGLLLDPTGPLNPSSPAWVDRLRHKKPAAPMP
jgi:hypothetical protein